MNRLSMAPTALTVLLATAACGGSQTDEAALADDEVATLVAEVMDDDDETGDGDQNTGGDGDQNTDDPEQAALAFSQCMRDEGLDFPDLGIDAEGNIDLRAGLADVDRNSETFRSARAACQDELAGGGFGGGPRQALDSPEVQDGLVAFSDCIRAEGFDVGDLTLGQNGGGAPGAGAAAGGSAAGGGQADGGASGDGQDGDGQSGDGQSGDGQSGDGQSGGPAEGRREGGFGDRNARIARQLGLDPEEPEVAAALETCEPILTEAFSSAGIGQPNQNNG